MSIITIAVITITRKYSLQVLHYAQELFEGMKAYRGVDGKIRLFRPMHNMARMNLTASRACLPAFDGYQLLECIRKYVVLFST